MWVYLLWRRDKVINFWWRSKSRSWICFKRENNTKNNWMIFMIHDFMIFSDTVIKYNETKLRQMVEECSLLSAVFMVFFVFFFPPSHSPLIVTVYSKPHFSFPFHALINMGCEVHCVPNKTAHTHRDGIAIWSPPPSLGDCGLSWLSAWKLLRPSARLN